MMGFNPTFYAGRPKLSEVTIDSDLNMGGRNISNVDTIGVNLMRAGRVDSPYMPQTWPTEELGWGTPAAPTLIASGSGISADGGATIVTKTLSTTAQVTATVTLHDYVGYSGSQYIKVFCEGVLVEQKTLTGIGVTWTSSPFWATGTVTVTVTPDVWDHRQYVSAELHNTGEIAGPKTFNLSGKWLALGIDMKGLAATVKIQGVTMPYSDYAKYFPLAPSEVTIPGGWSPSQERPVIKVYK